jgi:hypothetical protein
VIYLSPELFIKSLKTIRIKSNHKQRQAQDFFSSTQIIIIVGVEGGGVTQLFLKGQICAKRTQVLVLPPPWAKQIRRGTKIKKKISYFLKIYYGKTHLNNMNTFSPI